MGVHFHNGSSAVAAVDLTQFFTPFKRNDIALHIGVCRLKVSQKCVSYTHKYNENCLYRHESGKASFPSYSPLFLYEICDAASDSIVSRP
jgi:hypothetical protein